MLKSKLFNITMKAEGERVEMTAYSPQTGISLVSKAPEDDEKYIYIGQAPNSNFLDLNSPNIDQLYHNGVDIIALRKFIEKLNEFLKTFNHAQGEASAESLRKAASRQVFCNILAIVSVGLCLPCCMGNTFSYMGKYNTRRNFAFKAALRYCITTAAELEASKVGVIIPRSFPAYIQVSRSGDVKDADAMNKMLLDEIEKLEMQAAMRSRRRHH